MSNDIAGMEVHGNPYCLLLNTPADSGFGPWRAVQGGGGLTSRGNCVRFNCNRRYPLEIFNISAVTVPLPSPDPSAKPVTTAESSSSATRLATGIGVLLIGLALYAGWRHYSHFEWRRFATTFELIDHRWLLGGLGLAVLSFGGRTLRWQFMMRPERSSFFRVLSATLAGFAMVVLVGRPGEFIRPYLIARQESSSIAKQAAIWLLERLYDLLMILILFGLGLAYARRLDIPANSNLIPLLRAGGWIVSVGAALAAAILYALSRRRAFCEQRLGLLVEFLPHRLRERFQHSLKSFLAGTAAAGDWSSLLGCLGLTFAEWLVILLSVWCYFQAYPDTSGFRLLDVAAFWGFVAIGAVVQLPGVGGGMQIASIFVLTELFELPVEAATGLSLLIWAGSSLIALPIGLPFAFHAGLNLKEINKIGEANL